MSEQAGLIADARARAVAALAAQFRDLDLAEEAVGAGLEALLRQAEPPADPAAWLYVAARRKALDLKRAQASEARKHAAFQADLTESDMSAEILAFPDPIPDERLRLVFICCHPALSLEARAALTMRVVCGVPVGEIAQGFLVSEAAMARRITRAKDKVRNAGVPFETPSRAAWAERLEAVLLTLELSFTSAYRDAAHTGDRGALAEEIERLTAMLAQLLPDEPEVLGLAALVALAASREAARVDADGVMVPLSEQDAGLWDRARIEAARRWLEAAAALGRVGPYQTMAAIQLTHARRLFDGKVDWEAIRTLYDALFAMRPTAVVAVNRAVAIGRADIPQAGLDALAMIDTSELAGFRPYHVARAHLLAKVGDVTAARDAYAQALDGSLPPAERLFLERKRAALDESEGA